MRRCVLVIFDGTFREALVEAARSRGWMVDRALEVPSSQVRAGLAELRQLAYRARVNAVVFQTLGLPGLGVLATLRELHQLAQLDVEVASVQEPWASTVGGQGQQICWILARLEDEHRARIRASLDKVRAEGRPLGRPRAIIPTEQVLQMRAGGASLRAIARATKLGVSTIQRFLVAFDQVDVARKAGVR